MPNRHRPGYHHEYHQQHYVPVANPKLSGRPRTRTPEDLRIYQRKYQRQYHRDRAHKLRVYKALRGCADCGEHDPIVLEFDHVRGEKLLTIADARSSRSWASIMEEIEKCEVVCANCHRRREAIRRELSSA